MDDKMAECKSRAALYGLSTGSLVFSVFFLMQRFAMKDYRKKPNFLPKTIGTSLVFAGACTYLVVQEKLIECDRKFDVTRTDGLAKFKNQEK